jgi:mRNA-degrading endonuclease toxin of MazEF toxin-antitoxin module
MGFLPAARLERFVVLQSDRLTRVLETVVAVPLDEARPEYEALPGLVGVSAGEAGTKSDQVAIVTQVTTLSLSRFDPTRSGRLKTATLMKIGKVLKFILELS